MADEEHLKILKQGVDAWNKWRNEYPEVSPNLQKADLSGAYLKGADRREANFTKANFSEADLSEADFSWTTLHEADFTEANLEAANLSFAQLTRVNFTKAKLLGADLKNADLRNALFVETDINDTILTGCKVYGISVWGLKGTPKEQNNLLITSESEAESATTVDDLGVAQFIYLVINYERFRDVIDAMTSKTVLILGSFKLERKAVLNAIAQALRLKGYIPVLFDFDKPEDKTFSGTVVTIANLTRFVIADFTDAKIALDEARMIAQTGVYILPIMRAGSQEPATLTDLQAIYKTVSDTERYNEQSDIVAFIDRIIEPADAHRQALVDSHNRAARGIMEDIQAKRLQERRHRAMQTKG